MESVPLFTLLGFGFLIGLRHAFEADHVVAVSTIVSQTKSLKASSIFGAIWGLGHTTTLFVIGLLILLFKLTIPNRIALSLEFLVGIVLVILGIDVLRKIVKNKIHIHKHQHHSSRHAHFHSHLQTKSHTHPHARSFTVGLIHGLAGSSALMLLVLATTSSVSQGLLYIALFGLGSILGMLLMATLIGLPFLLTSKFDRLNNTIQGLAGATSIAIGLTIMFRIGFLL